MSSGRRRQKLKNIFQYLKQGDFLPAFLYIQTMHQYRIALKLINLFYMQSLAQDNNTKDKY
jgi:hypothetical protein